MDYLELYNYEEFLKFKDVIDNYVKNGFTNKASMILTEVLNKCSDHPGVYYLLGSVYYSTNEYMKAIKYLNQAVFYDESNDEYLALLGLSYLEANNYEEAYKRIKSAYKINDRNLTAIVALGKIELINNNPKEAFKYANLALSIEKDNYDSIRLMSKYCTYIGEDNEKTLEYLYKARGMGKDKELDFDIIKVLYMANETEKCLKECKKLIAKNPNSLEAQKARELIAKIKGRSARKVEHNQNKYDTSNNNYNKNNNEDTVKRESASLEEALDKINLLIGLENVKKEIDRIVKFIQFDKNRSKTLGIESNSKASYHFMFLGNPGTGKTTVARLIGDILFYLGVLEKGHLVEVDRSKIVGQYIGQTAQLTKAAIESAMNGILFIDEAYSLARGGAGSNDYGAEAIDTLIKAMEDQRGNIVVIVAGYTKEMRELIKLNPGLKSRINLEIEFDNYNDDELLKIAKAMLAENHYTLSTEGEKAFIEKINREKVDDNFANGRSVRNIIEAAIREKAFRIGDKSVSVQELSTITNLDFGIEINVDPEDKIVDLIKELEDMVGLESVKSTIKNIVKFVQYQQKKKEMGFGVENIELNMVFTGNPGTGKTTVARLVSKIFKALDVVKKGDLVEVTREGLVGQYVGQTASKTLDKIKEAYGGILFIDEAYTLAQGGENDFGKEAIATLIKEMEDNRDKLVVIMAGYTDDMEDLLVLNPGFKSRIGFTVEFPDYTPIEMINIFKGLCEKDNYKLEEDAYMKLLNIFSELYGKRDKNFGNGRLVRQYFQKIKMKQAERVMNSNFTNEDMFKITIDDICIISKL